MILRQWFRSKGVKESPATIDVWWDCDSELVAPDVDRDDGDGDDDLLAVAQPPSPPPLHDIRPQLLRVPTHLLLRGQGQHLETAPGVQASEHSGPDTSPQQSKCPQCKYCHSITGKTSTYNSLIINSVGGAQPSWDRKMCWNMSHTWRPLPKVTSLSSSQLGV